MPLGLWALAIGAFGIGTTEFLISGILNQIAHTFQVTIPQAGYVATAYALGVFISAPVVAIIGSRFPRKYVLMVCATLFTLGNLITAFAPSLDVAIIGRVITALNHGGFFGIGSLVASSLVDKSKKAQAIAFMFAGMAVANLLGIPFGTWLSQVIGWQHVFIVIGAIGILTLLGLFFLLPADIHHGQTEITSELRAFMDPQVLLAMGITVLGPSAFFISITYIEPMALNVTGLQTSSITVLMVLFGLGLVVGNYLGGKCADRSLFGTLLVSLLLQGIALLFMWLDARSAIVVGTMVFFMAAFGFATVSPIQKLVMERANAAGAATLAASVNIGMFNLGNALGAALGGFTIHSGFGLASPAWAGAGLSFAALILALVAYKTNRPVEEIHAT